MKAEEEIYKRIWKNKKIKESKDIEKGSRGDVAFRLLDTGNKLLDIGCGDGTFCEMAEKRYKEVYGVDISEDALETARNRKIKTFMVNLNNEELPFPEGIFDAVTCLDVIEHVIDPYFLLSEINRVLKKGGILIVATPNIGYIKHRISLLFGRFPITSKDEEAYEGGHLHYFTFSDMEKLLKKFGFDTLERKGVFGRNVLPNIFSGGIVMKARKGRECRLI